MTVWSWELVVADGRWEAFLVADTVDKGLVILQAEWLYFLVSKCWL